MNLDKGKDVLNKTCSRKSQITDRKWDLYNMQVPGFEPGLKAWKAFVLPGYTTPAFLGGCIKNIYKKISRVSYILIYSPR